MGACFVGYFRGASGAIPGAHCKIHNLLGTYSSTLSIHHLQGRSSKGRSSGALGIRVKTVFRWGMGVEIPTNQHVLRISGEYDRYAM